MTKQDLHNTYNASQLKEYCKENDMISSGKKPVLIKRILKFLETGEKEQPKGKRTTTAGESGKKRKKDSAATGEEEGEEEEGGAGEQEEEEGSKPSPRKRAKVAEEEGDHSQERKEGENEAEGMAVVATSDSNGA
ncbi:DNA replication factor [Balamuthia mandrillaris]